MDKTIDLSICSLISGLLWVTGFSVFALVAGNIIDGDWTGIGLSAMVAGSTLYLRRLHIEDRTRESVLFELGQLSAGTQASRGLHRVH